MLMLLKPSVYHESICPPRVNATNFEKSDRHLAESKTAPHKPPKPLSTVPKRQKYKKKRRRRRRRRRQGKARVGLGWVGLG